MILVFRGKAFLDPIRTRAAITSPNVPRFLRPLALCLTGPFPGKVFERIRRRQRRIPSRLFVRPYKKLLLFVYLISPDSMNHFSLGATSQDALLRKIRPRAGIFKAVRKTATIKPPLSVEITRPAAKNRRTIGKCSEFGRQFPKWLN